MLVFVVAGLAALLALTVFQIAVVAGAPLGEYTWGGRVRVPTRSLRIAAAVSIVLYAVFAAFLLSRAGVASFVGGRVLTVGMWAITAYSVFSIVPNAISRSRKERLAMTPLSIILAASFLAVAVAG